MCGTPCARIVPTGRAGRTNRPCNTSASSLERTLIRKSQDSSSRQNPYADRGRRDRLFGQDAQPSRFPIRAGGGPGRSGAPTGEAQEGVFDGSIFQGVEGNGAESTRLPEYLRRSWYGVFKVRQFVVHRDA